MKEFAKWLVTSTIHTEQSFACERAMEEAFKAGMLASADIAWTSDGIPSHGYDEGREDAAEEIREAAKDGG